MLPGSPISRSCFAAALVSVFAAIATWLSTSEVNVVLVTAPRTQGVSLRAVVYSGSADDPAGKEGLASLTANVMRIEMAQRAGPLADSLAVSVGKDVIVFGASAPKDDGDRLIEMLKSAMLEPSFDPEVVEQQRARQRQALESELHETRTLASEAFDALVFRGHPYAHPVLGRESSLGVIAREDLLAFHAAHWRKGNVAFGVAGEEPAPVGARLRSELAGLPDGAPERAARPVSWLPRPRVVAVEAPSAGSAAVRVGHLLDVTRAHPDYFALKLATLQAGAADDAASIGCAIEIADTEEGRAGGTGLPRRQQAFVMDASPIAADAAGVAQAAIERVVALRDTSFDGTRVQELLRLARERPPYPAGDAALELAGRMDEFLFRTPGFAQRYAASIEATGPDAMKGAIARGLHPDRLGIVAVVPDAKAFVAALLAPATGGKRSNSPSLTADDIEVVSPESLAR